MDTCKRCGHILHENALYCSFCGRKVNIPPTHKKRGNGTGTAIKRGNTWTAIVNAATYVENGQLKRKRISKGGFRTKKEALAYIPTLQKKADGSLNVDSDMTLEQLYKMWESQHENDVSHSTMNCYRAAWKYYDSIKYYKVRNIKTATLQDCLDNCGQGKRTQENMKSLGTMLFRMALANDLTSRNYAENLIPRGERQEPRTPFTDVELAKMFKIVNDPQNDGVEQKNDYLDYVLVLCYTGFRVEELLNLTRESYHEEMDWAYFIGGSKTEAGRGRIVGISPKILPIVKRHLKDGYIFSEDGKKLSAKKFRQMYYQALELADIEKRVPHCCRHTFATLMKNVDAADKDKMEMIGHSSIAMTMEYTHSDMEGLKNLTARL